MTLAIKLIKALENEDKIFWLITDVGLGYNGFKNLFRYDEYVLHDAPNFKVSSIDFNSGVSGLLGILCLMM